MARGDVCRPSSGTDTDTTAVTVQSILSNRIATASRSSPDSRPTTVETSFGCPCRTVRPARFRGIGREKLESTEYSRVDTIIYLYFKGTHIFADAWTKPYDSFFSWLSLRAVGRIPNRHANA